MPPKPAAKASDGLWKNFLLHVSLVLLLFILGIFLGIFFRNEEMLNQQTLAKARACYESIVMARLWNADYHGVYVEKAPGTVSNPYLQEPDILGRDGRVFTMKNPALMLREISQYGRQKHLFQFRINSLMPLNPQNMADRFEEKALNELTHGQTEAHWKETSGDQTTFRYLAPLRAEASCLTCHTTQGYKLGDVMGGVTVSFDISDLERSMSRQRVYIWLLAGATVANLLGIIFLLVGRLRARVLVLQRQLEEQAIRDELTGLFNRRHLLETLTGEIARAQRYAHPLSLLMVDVDHFKVINDTRGHLSGDLVLRGLADILGKTCRQSDTAGRYGGEEFAVLAPHTRLADALVMAEKIRAEVRSRSFQPPDGQPMRVTVSIGVAELGQVEAQDELLAERLIALADAALYRAKEAGRDRVASA